MNAHEARGGYPSHSPETETFRFETVLKMLHARLAMPLI